ncbi:cytochrome P450 71A1 [Sesbania bispinosa]|nr:cytochrome P450 71A1 [Sesbania bispinosa]
MPRTHSASHYDAEKQALDEVCPVDVVLDLEVHHGREFHRDIEHDEGCVGCNEDLEGPFTRFYCFYFLTDRSGILFFTLCSIVYCLKALNKKFDRFMEHALVEHIERRKGVKDYVSKVMVDVLLQLAEDPALEVKLKRHGVKVFS